MNKDKKTKEVQSTDTFVCKGCGNIMRFDPDKGMLYCDYCNSSEEFKVEYTGISENDFTKAIGTVNNDWGEQRAAFICESCGASITLGNNEIAGTCPFCGQNHILKVNDFAGDICPSAVIPFTVSSDKAESNFSNWIKKKLFAPTKLKKQHSHDKLKGVYIPAWTYDADTSSDYRAMGGEVYYTTERYTTVENGKTVTKTRQVRHVRWYPVRGNYAKFMDDILVTASKKIDITKFNSTGSFDMRRLVKYSPEFLAGFSAERYSINITDGWNDAQIVIRNRIEQGISKKILEMYDEVKNISFNTIYNNITYKHLLLPVWLSSFLYKEKRYEFMVNGQSGKIFGKTPVSPLRVFIAVLIALAVLAGIAALLMLYEGNG